MDWDGKVEAPKFICHASGDALPPGSDFYSTLDFQNGLFVRADFSPVAWTGLNKEAFLSWWRQRVPAADDAPRFKPIDAQALLRIFDALKSSSERHKQCFVYIVTLFLMRTRKLKHLKTIRDETGTFLVVEDRRDQQAYKICDPGMTAEEEAAVQQNLLQIVDLADEELPA